MASTNRRAAPARSRRSAPRGSKRRTAPKQKRKLFDYPRTGFHGLHRWLPSWRVVLGTMLGVAFLGAGAVVAAYASTEIPDPAADTAHQTTTVYFAPHDDGSPGAVMGTFADEKRKIVEYSTLPAYVGQATAAAEDKSFFTSNAGVSIKGMTRALINNLKGGRTEGGSTLTQQYVERYLVGTTTTSYTGKVHEALLAIKIAKQQSKPDIMGAYLNTIYYGRDSYGIQAAAQAYFGVDAASLTVEQAALLAGIIPSPNNWDPAVSPAKAQARWNIVLDSMVDSGWLTGTARAGMTFPATIAYKPSNTMAGTNGYLLQMVKDEMQSTYSVTDDDLHRKGYSIITTIKEDMQAAAVDQANQFAAGSLDGQGGVAPNADIRASISTLDPATGAILALYGGPDYLTDPRNRTTFDQVQAGSTFKPFTLIAALEQGIPLTTTFSGRDNMLIKGWDTDPKLSTVGNFGNESFGSINLVKATADSVNTVYAQLNMKVGADKTADVATRAGIAGPATNNANVLGTETVAPLEMLNAYGTLASGGTYRQAHIVGTVDDFKGNVVYTADTKGKQVFAPDVIADATYAMQQVVQDPTGTAHQWISPLHRPIAGKTGTQQTQKAAWFVGFTPNVVTEVSLSQQVAEAPHKGTVPITYVSKLASEKTGVTGGTVPAFLWQSYMKKVFAMPAYATVLDFPARANVGADKKATAAPKATETVAPPAPTVQAPQQIAVPAGLEGKLEADATAAVVNAGLSPNTVSESSDTVPAGRVVRIDPGGGTILASNGTVTIVVSTGPKAAPTPTPPAPAAPAAP